MLPNVTLLLTSCNRFNLLEKTLLSFVNHNTHKIDKTVIVDDSAAPVPDFIRYVSGLGSLGEVVWISNGVRKGQIYTADRVWGEAKTEYCFWSEDDWEYVRGGFIEESLAILEQHKNIVQCWLRDDSSHPVIDDPRFTFQIMKPNWEEGWSGWCFNPGLRRLSDYRKIGSYGRHVGYDTRFVGELELSKLYYSMGMFAAKLPTAVRHIGEAQHIPWATAPKPPRVLIAIPCCHSYNYGSYKDKRIGHVDRDTHERIEAQRATWVQDVKAFKSYVDLRFFYGRKPDGQTPGFSHDRRADEVFLGCPDDYEHLPHKSQAIFLWALRHGYDYVFKVDDDTFVYVDRLMASGFEHHDYLGYCYPSHGNYISGGPGYWVSHQAMRHLVDANIEGWAEDKWVGGVLKSHGIRPTRDGRYLPGFDAHYVDMSKIPADHNYISFHACAPETMRKLYEHHPSPTFRFQHSAVGEGHYPDAAKFELNIKPYEAGNGKSVIVTHDKHRTDGGQNDPRRASFA